MRILFLTNFYPPLHKGGFEQWCQEVAESLRTRGHEILVLTSNFGRERLDQAKSSWIRRELNLEMELVPLRNSFNFFSQRRGDEKENLDRLEHLIEHFYPEAILIWGMWNIHRSVPALAEKLMPGKVAYYMGDYWPSLPSPFETYWQAPARNWVFKIPKSLLKVIAHRILASENQPSLRFEHVIYPTAFMREEFKRKNISIQKSIIIYGAIDTTRYQPRNGSSVLQQNGALSLLYVGRLTPEKGVHTAIEALGYLVRKYEYLNLVLTIVGTGETDYQEELRKIARQEKVEPLVVFMGPLPKESMPIVFNNADIFLFTSIWPEPFGRVIVEAMASGVAVIGTATGGAAEILIKNENALIYQPGNAISMAEQIARLIELPSLRRDLIRAGRQTALTKFDLQRMATEIEIFLESLMIGSDQTYPPTSRDPK